MNWLLLAITLPLWATFASADVSSSGGSCRDVYQMCPFWPRFKFCNRYAEMGTKYCAKTCGKCGTTSGTTGDGTNTGSSGNCNPVTIQNILVGRRKEAGELLKAGDPEGFTSNFFTNDAIIMSPGRETAIGFSGMLGFAKSIPPERAGFISQQAATYQCMGSDYAVEMGPYPAGSDQAIRIINIWYYDNGSWKVKVNMDTKDNPPTNTG